MTSIEAPHVDVRVSGKSPTQQAQPSGKRPVLPRIYWTPGSSWIQAIALHAGVLTIFLKEGGAVLYGPEFPSYLYANLCKAGLNGQSVGKLYHRLVRGKFQSQKVEPEQAKELMSLASGKKITLLK